MRILHTADTQLGYKQYGFQERYDDFTRVVGYIFQRAMELKVDAVCIAGDIFEMPQPPASCVLALQQAVYAARQSGIQVFGVEGNHDPADRANSWLSICGILPLDSLDEDHPAIHHIVGKDGTQVRVAGFNFYRTPILLERLKKLVVQIAADNQKLDVLVLHTSVAEMAGFRGVDLTAMEVGHIIHPTGVRVVMLGDIHDYKEMDIGGIRFIYPGAPELNSISEQATKTFTVVDIGPDYMRTELHPLPTRPLVHYHVKDEEGVDMLLAHLQTHKDQQPMFVLTYNPDLPDFQKRARSMLEGKALYKLIPLKNEGAIGLDLLTKMSQQSFERKGALRNLHEVLTTMYNYSVESPQFQLITQCLERPDEVMNICHEFAKAQGLNIRVLQ